MRQFAGWAAAGLSTAPHKPEAPARVNRWGSLACASGLCGVPCVGRARLRILRARPELHAAPSNGEVLARDCFALDRLTTNGAVVGVGPQRLPVWTVATEPAARKPPISRASPAAIRPSIPADAAIRCGRRRAEGPLPDVLPALRRATPGRFHRGLRGVWGVAQAQLGQQERGNQQGQSEPDPPHCNDPRHWLVLEFPPG